MNSGPVMRCGDAVVVYDGPRRLIWERIGAARWRPRRVWPNTAEREMVHEAMHRGDPVLIILDARPEPVQVLAEELDDAPREVTNLVGSVSGEVAELRIAPLTWLPAPLAQRGERFLRDMAATVSGAPRLLLPSLILQPGAEAGDTVWFGLRVRSTNWSDHEVRTVVDHLRTARPGAAASVAA